MKIRTRAGEYLGQDTGDVIRISYVQELTDAPETAIEQAAYELGAQIVVGVILFR